MAAVRFYFGAPIEEFLEAEPNAILGEMTKHATQDINKDTSNSWLDEIEVMKDVLTPYARRGSVYFEYNIPRMGKRADVIVLIDGIVFVLEFKTGEQKFTHEALRQVWDYALDLKNFQLECRDRAIVPMLVCPGEKDKHCLTEIAAYKDLVYQPLSVNISKLGDSIGGIVAGFSEDLKFSSLLDEKWAKGGYDPTPTIIEAAIALYEHHTVDDITKHTGDVARTQKCLTEIIEECQRLKRKAICFVTGVPGAGKTLIGLQTAIDQFRKEKAVYLSGNFPLVEVLQEALARDYVRRSKDEYRQGLIDKPVTKKVARSEVKTFIQMIHHYRDLYLQGTEVVDGSIQPIAGYFQSHEDKAYVPTEHVAIFDEAQRAWTKEELARFMKEKKQIADFPYSEPEYLISCMDRHKDWGLVVCLIGGGQEINKGEAGIEEWINSINRSFPDWHVYMSDKLTEKEYADGRALEIVDLRERLHVEPDLHLAVSMRSFRAEKVSLFVHQLLAREKDAAKATLAELENYPIVMTRSLETAKQWLRDQSRGSERVGLLASSKAERLKAININVRYQPDFVHWFLEEEPDVRSSNALEDTLTEFKVQGLEIDWACVAWDADLRYNAKDNKWSHWQLRSGTTWQRINKSINKDYQINAYRVLLTRARQGMIILIPNGDHGFPPDDTRRPEWYDAIHNYLQEVGIPEVK